MAQFQRRRILIWGKTAPELSAQHYETVCTGGVFDNGEPVRLFPIPFRYLDQDEQFKKYQWITANVARTTKDPRPESHKIDCETIEVGESIPTDDWEWGARQNVVLQNPCWQFQDVDALLESHARTNLSLGVVVPKEILSVDLRERPDEEGLSFEQKRAALLKKLAADKEQRRLFEEMIPPEMKNLDFIKNRVQVRWVCAAGKTHTMQILDWEVIELQRKIGDEKACDAIRGYLDLSKYAIRFFLGNLFRHPSSFTIVGLWYPKRKPKRLFD